MLKKMIILLTTICLFFLVSVNVYAGTVDDDVKNSFFKDVDFNVDVIPDNQLSATSGTSVGMAGGNGVTSSAFNSGNSNDAYNVFGDFSLNKGFDKKKITTFSSSRSLSGVGDEGIIVGVKVYSKDLFGNLTSNYQSVKELGASGLFSDLIEFKKTGVYYMVIKVVDGKDTWIRWFELTKKEEETKDYLENIQINFIKTQTPEKSTFPTEILKQLSGVK